MNANSFYSFLTRSDGRARMNEYPLIPARYSMGRTGNTSATAFQFLLWIRLSLEDMPCSD